MPGNSQHDNKFGQAQGATSMSPRPVDFPLGSPESRAAARLMLNTRLKDPEKRFRLIVRHLGPSDNTIKPTCKRQWWPDGTLFEEVIFNGSDITDEELDDFVQGFPIEESQ